MNGTATHRPLVDLSVDEYYDHLDALRVAVKAEDEGLSELEFVRSEFDPQRYTVVFHGVAIGWVVRATCTGRWMGYKTEPGSVMGKLVDEAKTRKHAAVEVAWKASR